MVSTTESTEDTEKNELIDSVISVCSVVNIVKGWGTDFKHLCADVGRSYGL
jgi:hypothetical protein